MFHRSRSPVRRDRDYRDREREQERGSDRDRDRDRARGRRVDHHRDHYRERDSHRDLHRPRDRDERERDGDKEKGRLRERERDAERDKERPPSQEDTSASTPLTAANPITPLEQARGSIPAATLLRWYYPATAFFRSRNSPHCRKQSAPRSRDCQETGKDRGMEEATGRKENQRRAQCTVAGRFCLYPAIHEQSKESPEESLRLGGR